MLISIFKANINLVISSTLLIALFSSCQSNKTDGSTSHKQNISSRTDSLIYRDTIIREISKYFPERDGEIDTSFVNVSYPIFQDSVMNKRVMENILLEGETTIDQYIDNFLEGYGNFVEENNVKYPIAWEKSTDVIVEMNNPYLIMLSNITYEYSGGAHGNSFTLWNVYDAQNYKKLALNTFISENKMKEFTKIAERFFRQEEGLTDTTSLESDYFFENDTFALAANYGISKEGIMFYFNPYEIKPYSEGPTLLTIPFEGIQDCMTETGKNYIKNVKEYNNSIQ